MKNSGIWLVLVIFCVMVSLASWEREAKSVSGGAEVAVEKKYIALTFDDGPHPTLTPRLLDGLKERGAKATFFVVGIMTEENREIVVRMQKEGHQVGNHTYEHMDLSGAGKGVDSIKKNNELLCGILDEGCYWVRPPWGYVTEEVKSEIDVPMVYWSIDTEDWLKLNVEKVLDAALQAGDGDIVLMHDIYPTTVEAALDFVDIMQSRGYEFVTVEELLEKNGIDISRGVLYRKGDGTAVVIE